MVITLNLPYQESESGLRPVNLRTDLIPLADLIEIAFADTMDSNGRAALREMRMLSKIGAGLNLLSRMNEMTLGISMGYVWIEAGQLVGNVSVYPANWHRDLGSVWIIANVGVHPDYQRRGIARRLMQASLDMIRDRGGDSAILQVDYHNDRARDLYLSLGFYEERTFTLWRRPASVRLPMPLETPKIQISRRRPNEWQAEYALAQRVRPLTLGGLGWQRPLHVSLFRPNVFQWFGNLINFSGLERLVIRSADRAAIEAALWVETGLSSATRLTLMVQPEKAGVYDDALLGTVVRRYGGDPLTIEHPMDETTTNEILERYRFHRQRTIVHMRWNAR